MSKLIKAAKEAKDVPAVRFVYTNYRGEPSIRIARPIRMWFGSTEYHPEPQWLFTAFDVDKGQKRDFALADCDFSVAEHAT